MAYGTYTKLYDSCVCPITDYSSGVWGYGNFSDSDTLQNKAQRIFLGVHKFAPILVLEGDMGWLSPRYRRWMEMIRLWNRMLLLPDNRLTKIVFNYDYENSTHGVNNWCSKLISIFTELDQTEKYLNKESIDLLTVRKLLLSKQETQWKESLPHKPKLRFYTLFKEDLAVENFARYNLTSSERSLTAQFRMGILPLEVETRRFHGVKLENRVCKLCTTGLIEDEFHFLFVCPLYDDIRGDLFTSVLDKRPDFIYLIHNDQCKVLFTEFHRKLAKYLRKAYECRKASLFI